MEFNWTTFVVEIINFLILVWILKRLLYTPINNAIVQRKKSIQDTLDAASKMKEEAKVLEDKYSRRLLDWEKEKDASKKNLQKEILRLKNVELEKLHKTLDEEKEKNQVLEKRRLKKQEENMEKQAFALATDFAAKFLKSFVDVGLEKKIINEFLRQFSKEPKDQKEKLLVILKKENSIKIQTGFPIDDETREHVENTFRKLSENKIEFYFEENADLMAGISVEIGAFNLQANVRDELKYFAGVASESV